MNGATGFKSKTHALAPGRRRTSREWIRERPADREPRRHALGIRIKRTLTAIGENRGMKFVTYNIQCGQGRDGRYDLDRTAKAVEGADVIALQEVERFWKRSGNVDEVAGLTERLPDFHWVYAPAPAQA